MCRQSWGLKRIMLLALLLLLVLTACGGGGGGHQDGLAGSCAHLTCLPHNGVAGAVKGLLEDAADGGVIDEGESRLGDALLRAAAALDNAGK